MLQNGLLCRLVGERWAGLAFIQCPPLPTVFSHAHSRACCGFECAQIGSLDLYRHRYTYAMAPGPLPGAALHALGPGPSALAAAAATTGTTAAAPAPGSADPAAAAAPHPVAGASSSRPGSDVGAGVSGEGSSGPLEGTSTSGPTHSNTNTNSSPPGPAPGPAAAAAADAAGASSAPATSTGPVHVPPTSHSLRRLALHNQRGAPPDAPQGPLALVALGACCPRLSSLSASVFGAPTYQQLFMAPLPWDLAELELQVQGVGGCWLLRSLVMRPVPGGLVAWCLV